jgi:hypothetical protein
MHTKWIAAAFGFAISMCLASPGMSNPLEGSIIEEAAEDEALKYCDRLEDKCDDGKAWACRALERECDD